MVDDARSLILAALEQTPEITGAGASSLLGIAARALDPAASITRQGLSEALGLHPSVIIAALVTADLLGASQARREAGQRLFASLKLRGRPPWLTPTGQLAVCRFCISQLEGLEPLFDGAAREVRKIIDAALAGEPPDRAALDLVVERALELQRTKVVPMERGSKTKLGIPDDEAARRRGAQALRAVLAGLREPTPTDHLSSTVAGEVAGTLCLLRGSDPATAFLLALAEHIEALPSDQAQRPPGN